MAVISRATPECGTSAPTSGHWLLVAIIMRGKQEHAGGRRLAGRANLETNGMWIATMVQQDVDRIAGAEWPRETDIAQSGERPSREAAIGARFHGYRDLHNAREDRCVFKMALKIAAVRHDCHGLSIAASSDLPDAAVSRNSVLPNGCDAGPGKVST